MSELTIDRRQAVRAAAGVAAGSMLVAGAGVGSATANGRHDRRDRHDRNHSSALEGSWLVTHRDSPPAPAQNIKGVVSLIPGGVIINNDIDPMSLPATGSWASLGGGRFVATFWGGFPAEGKDPAGIYKIQVSGQLNSNGTVSGTYQGTGYPKGGKAQSFTGTFTGTKISAA